MIIVSTPETHGGCQVAEDGPETPRHACGLKPEICRKWVATGCNMLQHVVTYIMICRYALDMHDI